MVARNGTKDETSSAPKAAAEMPAGKPARLMLFRSMAGSDILLVAGEERLLVTVGGVIASSEGVPAAIWERLNSHKFIRCEEQTED